VSGEKLGEGRVALRRCFICYGLYDLFDGSASVALAPRTAEGNPMGLGRLSIEGHQAQAPAACGRASAAPAGS